MPIPLRLQQQLKRWYPLKPVAVQTALVEDPRRFIVVTAGRRSGKTERAKRKIVKACLSTNMGLYFIAAPTYSQVKKIYWKDIKDMSLSSLPGYKISETELMITFPNGTELHLIGLDKPTRIEGVPWNGGVIDECAYIKEEAWVNSIAPALDTKDPTRPDHKSWCWLIGKPDGLNWYYHLYQYALNANDPEWGAYTWKSIEVLDKSTVDAAKRRMPLKQFRQEYEASFETTSGRIYEEYNKENTTDTTIGEHEQICYYCDFNYTPMSHGIAVIRDFACDISSKKVIRAVYILDEIILDGVTGKSNALEFVEKYKNHKNKSLRLYGDRSGKNGEKHGIRSEYLEMEKVFIEHGWDVDRRVKAANPSIKDSQNEVRAKICNANGERSLFVNPITAPWNHEGFSTLCVKEGSSFIEDDKNEKQHIMTGVRYFINYEFPIEDAIMHIDIWRWGEYPDTGDI